MVSVAAPAQDGCVGDCDRSGEVTVDEIVTMVNLALNGGVQGCDAGDGNGDGSITVEEVVAAVNHALSGCPAVGEGLGVRRFSLSSESRFELLGLPIELSSNELTGHFDLEAGAVGDAGVRPLHLAGASDFIQIVIARPDGDEVVFCVQPIVDQFPLRNIGVLACDGMNDAGLTLEQNHNINDEDPTCSTGMADENPLHPDVCNGPLSIAAIPGASGPGAARIAQGFEPFVGGLPVNFLIEAAVPCGDEGAEPTAALFVLSTVLSRATVFNSDNTPGNTLSAERAGVNFDCTRWTQENGPGSFVMLVPLVDFDTGGLGIADAILSFQLTD